jgi:hypothetical protein
MLCKKNRCDHDNHCGSRIEYPPRARGLVQRLEQGQRRVCDLTVAGRALLEQVTPLVADAQRSVLGDLTAREQAQLLRLLSKMNSVGNLHYTRLVECAAFTPV